MELQSLMVECVVPSFPVVGSGTEDLVLIAQVPVLFRVYGAVA